MKLFLKLALSLLGVLVLVVGGALLYVDRAAHAAIERGGTRALGVETEVGSADVELLSGGLSLTDLSVANPEGFPSERFLELERGRAEIDLGTLLDPIVEVPRLELVGTRVNLERAGGRANYAVLLDALGADGEGPRDEDARGYVIGELLLRDVQVHVDVVPVGGELTRTTVPIDVIRLENVGTESDGGVLLDQLSGILVQAVLEAVAEKGVGALPGVVLEELRTGLAGLEALGEQGIELTVELGEALQETAEGVREAVEGTGEQAGEVLEDIGDVLEGDDG